MKLRKNVITILLKCHHNLTKDFEFQVDTKELNVKHLCKTWPFYDTVLSNWKKTNSPMWSHWAKFVEDGGLRTYTLPSERCNRQLFRYSLPEEEKESVCQSIYANEVVKLTVQIADPFVMVIEKDISATFSDMLGIVGKIDSLDNTFKVQY